MIWFQYFVLLCLTWNGHAAPADVQSMEYEKNLLKSFSKELLEKSWQAKVNGQIVGEHFTYSISSQLLKHLDQYLIELERSFDGIAFRSTMLTTGMQSIHSEYMLDQFWCTKRHFNPLREAHVEIINLQIDYGQMHLISGPNSTYRFVSIMDDWSVVFRLMADQVQPISIRSNYRWLPKGEIQIESFELLQNEPKTEIKLPNDCDRTLETSFDTFEELMAL